MNEESTLDSGPPAVKRRSLLYAGVAGAAALAGAGAALWKWGPGKVSKDEVAAIWPMNFDTPAGGALAMQSFRGRPLLLNFWATWCPPCVEEMPLLDRFFREHAGKSWQVVGLAIDQPSAVRTFLQRTPVTFPIGLAGLGGTELSKMLGNLSGGLPFTVVLAGTGDVVQRRMGRVTPADLGRWSQFK
jgi:thiol-disulfide isomerase/thioredoxin